MTCSNCQHNYEHECRRFPPVLVKSPEYLDDGDSTSTKWGFPPARARCGEFKPTDHPTE